MAAPAWLKALNAQHEPEAFDQPKKKRTTSVTRTSSGTGRGARSATTSASTPSYNPQGIQHTDPYSGTVFNPGHYATPETAQTAAELVGGEVIQGTPYTSGGPFQMPGAAYVDVDGDSLSDANAGLLAAKIAKNSDAPALLARQLRDEFGQDYSLPAGGPIETAANEAVQTGYNSGRYSGVGSIGDVLEIDREAEEAKRAVNPEYKTGTALGYEPNPNGTAWAEGVTPGDTPTSTPGAVVGRVSGPSGSITFAETEEDLELDPYRTTGRTYRPMVSGYGGFVPSDSNVSGYRPFGG